MRVSSKNSVLIFKFWLLSLLVVAAFPAFSDHPFRPQRISELGFTYRQNAYPVKGSLVWMDEAGLKRDFPHLRGLSSRSIQALILRNFSVVTEIQLQLRGTVIEDFEVADNIPHPIYHPDGYIRAGYKTFDPAQKTAEFDAGLVDLKGPGYSPEGMERVRDFFTPIEKLKGNLPITDEDLRFVQTRLATSLDEVRSTQHLLKIRDTDPPSVIRAITHALKESQKTADLYRFLVDAYQRKLAEGSLQVSDVANYIALLGKRDYTNGSAPVPRLLKEVVIQKAAQRVFDAYNAASGSNLQTVDSYFLIELPYKIRTPGGQFEQAGILGRQAHWRFGNVRDLLIPESVGVADILTSWGSSGQCDIFGAMIDFENVEIRQVGHLFQWNSRGEQELELQIRSALSSLRRTTRVTQLITGVVENPALIRVSDAKTPVLETDERTGVETFIRKVSDNAVSEEEVSRFLQKDRLGLFVAEIILLIHTDPQKAQRVLTAVLPMAQKNLFPALYLELLFPFALKDPQRFSTLVKVMIEKVASEIYAPVMGALSLEFARRLGADNPEIKKTFWYGCGSRPFVFFALYVIAILGENLPRAGFVEMAVSPLPENQRMAVKEIFDQTLQVFQGTRSLGVGHSRPNPVNTGDGHPQSGFLRWLNRVAQKINCGSP